MEPRIEYSPLIQQAGKPLYKGLFCASSDENSSRTYPLAWNVVQTVSSSVTAFIPDMSTWSASHFLLVLYMQLVASHEMDKESLGRWHILVAPGF